ncbi:hypothetical protein DRH29_00150 [candidate division Kazan bacterium]|uniref:Uncharacterized protein n=1 Tax=candidate division Kazan bacterium TaxID=2202143 RepID=A0A420ZDJ1_UNCK3|nr:MAG: hypothetical protein DRH29_00150 [candidate division Kazan bacterium]
MTRNVPTCLDVDKIIANLGRRRSGSIVYIDVCPPETEGWYLIARRGKRQEKVFYFLLAGLKHKLRKLGYVVVTTLEAKRKIREWKKEDEEWHRRTAEEVKRINEVFDRMRHPPFNPYSPIYGGRVAA